MILLIDAYNVLKQAMTSVFVSEHDRKIFIEQLGQYAKQRQHKIVLVFDGGPYDRATKEKSSGVYVIYSGSTESADDYIKRYVEDHSELDLLLISSDRELRSVAKSFEIESMQAHKFYKIFQDALRNSQTQDVRKSKTIKISKEENLELDELMKKGSSIIQSKVEDFVYEERSRKSKGHRLSKKERKKIKKIKKL
ncbi:NYN domain-containing protein [bacterium]|nr:NYN domain-containing protein [bacterium]